jgi:Tol biopolymer transport system component
MDTKGDPPAGPLWSLPVLGGSPRRLGDEEANAAAWSPDGKMLAYSIRSDLFVSKADGSESRKLITMPDVAVMSDLLWSPDSSHLRFFAWNTVHPATSLWEIAADGTGLHEMLPAWSKPSQRDCCGKWTADGKYFVFVSRGQVWAVPQGRKLFGSEPKPLPLTFSPMSLETPLPSKDGKKLFVVGRTFRGELVRYDSKSGQFSPFLGGISAEFVDFSKDGRWVAYVSYPEGTLWRSRVDGSERLQLSYPPGYAVNPRWSPDGKQILFYEMFNDQRSKIVEVSPEGGSPRPLMPDDAKVQWDPNWSPDGSKIVFGGNAMNAESTISILDLATHEVSVVPGSQGLYSPRWSPNGQYLVGLSADETILLLFDFQSQKWTELAKGAVAWPTFSKDGQYLYVLSGHGGSAVLKIRVSDGKAETVADLKNFVYTGRFGDSSLSLTPDDSPLLIRDAGTSDVYALDWEEP